MPLDEGAPRRSVRVSCEACLVSSLVALLGITSCGGATLPAIDTSPPPDPPPLASDDVPGAPECDTVLGTASAVQQATASAAPGTTVCIADGTYANFNLALVGNGTESAPIRVAAQHPGGVILTGAQYVGLSGQWLVVQGLRFQGGRSVGTNLIETRTRAGVCQHCRITEVVVTDADVGNTTESKWVGLYGDHNRLDHSAFSGKANVGSVVAVWRLSAAVDADVIDHNLFANRAPLGQNGAEAIRVGTGNFADSYSLTVVEQNLFDAMSGEAEIVSCKSGGNTFRYNTFRRSAGQLTLRNGSASTVEGNVFLTGGVPDAGGIRVIGPNHRVVNNYIEGVRTTSNTRGGIVLMAGDERRGSGAYYAPVVRALVAHNTLYDCQQSFVFGGGTSDVAPDHVTLANNLVAAPYGANVITNLTGITNASYVGNQAGGTAPSGVALGGGFVVVDARLTRAPDELMRPGVDSAVVGAAQGSPIVTYDVDRQTREIPLDVGADQVNGVGPTRHALTRADVGPRSFAVTLP